MFLRPRDPIMLPPRLLRVVLRLLPDLASGRALHRRALAAYAAGTGDDAEQWFEAAARRYRRELAVEPLARLRVHQLMARARTSGGPAGEAAAMVEIVHRLNRLDRLETLEPPFELADARSVLAQWLERAEPVRSSPAHLLPAAARVA